ncbi:MAG: hypothetical protein ACRC1D_09900, partial [Culicoidibacterales bacterium]
LFTGMLGGDLKCDLSLRGQPINIDMLLMMRTNMMFYMHVINYFAQCMITKRVWCDFKNELMRGEGGNDLFNEYLTVSDEAFIVLSLLNYHERCWTADFKQQGNLVSLVTLLFLLDLVIYL